MCVCVCVCVCVSVCVCVCVCVCVRAILRALVFQQNTQSETARISCFHATTKDTCRENLREPVLTGHNCQH